jgi:hypothetical protein
MSAATQYTFTAAGTSPSFAAGITSISSADSAVSDNQSWHLFISGTFGAAGALQAEYSPDSTSVSDASSRWFAPASLLTAAGGDTWFQAKVEKFRYVFTGGDGTTSVIAEIV